MREILFRSKRTDNGEWVYGDLMHKHYNFDTKATKVIHNNIMNYKVIPETVGQYTGLTDKNGKKIFEGDIVAMGTGRAYEVKYNNGSFYMDGTAILIKYVDRFEVIGNIHDNPELLKGGVK